MAATNRLNQERLAAATLELVPAGPVVVALGGGADSSVAAWTVAGRDAVRGIFVRHELAGSPALERAARAVAAGLEIGIEVVDAPVQPGPSLEDRARRARWQAIEQAVAWEETVVTGHTRDDQAETVLMNLLRGSGSAGLAGMSRSRPGVVRPLMAFTRAEIRSVAEDLSLPFVDDPANEDPTHLRNRIRADLLPTLERDYRPGIGGVLARTGTLAAADDRAIEDLADSIAIIDDGGAVMVASAALQTVPVAVAARAVRRALRRLLAPYAGTWADVDAVLRVSAGAAEAVTISGGLLVAREGPFVIIDPGVGEMPMETSIVVPSSLRFGEAAIRFELDDGTRVRRRSTLRVDAAVFGSDVSLRCPTEGDRIEFERGSKAVRTVLSERGVPKRRRSTWPLLVSGGRIAAIVGIRVAPWARGTTNRFVAIVYERGRL